MFIAMLTTKQQEALCKVVQYIAEVDGNVDYREKLLISALLEESALDEIPAAAKDMDEVKELLGRFDAKVAKRALLLESIGVALADDVVHPTEIRVIEELADGMGISRDWLDSARDYVQRALDVQREANDLLTA